MGNVVEDMIYQSKPELVNISMVKTI